MFCEKHSFLKNIPYFCDQNGQNCSKVRFNMTLECAYVSQRCDTTLKISYLSFVQLELTFSNKYIYILNMFQDTLMRTYYS